MEEKVDSGAGVAANKKSFKKRLYRGIELSQLLEFKEDTLTKLFRSRQRRRFSRGIHAKYKRLINKLIEAKKNCPAGEKPKGVKTHLRNCVIVPEMVGAIAEVYNGKVFHPVEVKVEMVGYYLAEFAMSYKSVRHGKLGVGATRSSKFTSLK